MFTQNLILELVVFVIICIVVGVSIYFKDTLIGHFIKNELNKRSESEPGLVESIDDLINRTKRSGSIVSDAVSGAVSDATSSIISSVISSVKSEK